MQTVGQLLRQSLFTGIVQMTILLIRRSGTSRVRAAFLIVKNMGHLLYVKSLDTSS